MDHLELNSTKDAKNNKKGFYRYVSQRREVKETTLPDEHDSCPPKTGKLVTTDKKTEVLNFFVSLITGNLSSHTSRGWTARWGQEEQSVSYCK